MLLLILLALSTCWNLGYVLLEGWSMLVGYRLGSQEKRMIPPLPNTWFQRLSFINRMYAVAGFPILWFSLYTEAVTGSSFLIVGGSLWTFTTWLAISRWITRRWKHHMWTSTCLSTLNLVTTVSLSVLSTHPLTTNSILVHVMDRAYVWTGTGYFATDFVVCWLSVLASPQRSWKDGLSLVAFSVHHVAAFALLWWYYESAPVRLEEMFTTLLLSELPVLLINFKFWQRWMQLGSRYLWLRWVTDVLALTGFVYFRLIMWNQYIDIHQVAAVGSPAWVVSLLSILTRLQYVFVLQVTGTWLKSTYTVFSTIFSSIPPIPRCVGSVHRAAVVFTLLVVFSTLAILCHLAPSSWYPLVTLPWFAT